MGENVVFFRPVEKVGTVVEVLQRCHHSSFPIVDTDDDGILYGTISSHVLCALLKTRSFGCPSKTSDGVLSNYIETFDGSKFVPIAGWDVVEGTSASDSLAYAAPVVRDIRISKSDHNLWLDLRPYANKAPITVQETASVEVRSSAYCRIEG